MGPQSPDPMPAIATAVRLPWDAVVEDPVATLADGGRLRLEATVSKGRGYVPADRNFDPEAPIGTIPLDSAHSPVRRVNYHVEAARVGQATDYDKLVIEVWTNGTISPRDAVGVARQLFGDHLALAVNRFRKIIGVALRQSSGRANELRRCDDDSLDRGHRANGVENVPRSLGVDAVALFHRCLFVAVGARGEM